MNEEEFLAHVRERAALDSIDEARKVTGVTLRVLGSRITDPEAEALAAQLPEAFDVDLTWGNGTGAESFGAETFVRCVHEREVENDHIDDIDADSAETHVKAVASVLNDVVTDDELSDVRAQLSDGYDRLFDPTGTET